MKRVADETITKEHGTIANPDATAATDGDTRKMATSAQMARRKLAQPKSRVNRSTTPTGPTSTPVSAPNPFASAGFGQQQQQPQQQPTFGASAGGFTFGQTSVSNSFPPTNASQQANAPNGGGFSFTFGAANNQPASNPFANANGSVPNGSNDTMMDASPQKPATNVFNFGGSTSTPAFAGFGQQPQTQQPPANPFTGLFGQSKPEEPKTNGGLFGQSPKPQENGASSTAFGEVTPSFSQPASSTPSLFGSTPAVSNGPVTTDSKPVDSPAKPLFNFGSAPTPISQPEAPAANTTPKLFSFGQTSTFGQSTSQTDSSATPSKPLFTGFGQPKPSTDPPQESATPKPIFSFGTPSVAEPASTEPAETPSQEDSPFGQSAPNLFGQPAQKEDLPASEPPQPAASETKLNPFAGLFSTPSPSKEMTPTFSFGQTSTPLKPASTNMFASAPQTASNSPFKFGTPAASAQESDPLVPNSTSTPATANLFNLNKPVPPAEQTENAAKNAALFQFNNNVNVSGPNKDSVQSTPPANPLATVNQTPTAPDSAHSEKRSRLSEGTTTLNKPTFGAPVTSPEGKPEVAAHTMAPTTAENLAPATRAVSTFGPPQIPRNLDPMKYKAYDENWRLRALNLKFQQAIAKLDYKKHDFMNIIQNYLDHREAIGDGLGGYERVKAGTKRKAIDVNDMQDDQDSSKKAKQITPSATFSATSTPQSSNNPSTVFGASSTQQPSKPPSSVFGASFTPQPANSPASVFGASPAKPATPSNSQTSTLFRSLIPGAQQDTPTSKSTTPPSSPPKSTQPQLPKFEVPKFGTGGSTSNFMSAFAASSAKSAEKAAQEAKEKRKLEEFDSDEDDEAEWEKQYEEEQRAKKAKIEAARKGGFTPSIGSDTSRRSESPFTFIAPGSASGTAPAKTPSFGASAAKPIDIESGNDTENEGIESGDSADVEDEEEDVAADGEAEQEEEEEEEGEPIPDLDPSQSLFSRISKPASPSKSANGAATQPKSTFFGASTQGTPDTPSFSAFTPSDASKSPFKPATTFNFSPAPGAPSPFGQSSMLGGSQTEVPNKFEGMFGSRPSTPSNAEKEKPRFTFGSSVANDNTWKVGSPIKFDTQDNKGPSIEVSEATPPQKPLQSLFGSTTAKAPTADAPSLGFGFTPKPAPGYLSASSHLDTPGSAFSSRANSPGLTDNESVATDLGTDDAADDEQVNLTEANPGEENEDVIFETLAKASRVYKKDEIEGTKLKEGWNTVGKGNLRVLKNKDTGKTRVVLRAVPGANILLNAALSSNMNYTSKPSGTTQGQVTFGLPVGSGSVQTWSLLVGSKDKADNLAKILQKNK